MPDYSISQALAELKLLDKRIYKKIEESDLVAAVKGKSTVVRNKYSIEDFSKEAIGAFNSINDLINRRHNIYIGILLSNSVSKIKINGVEMTVTEAISKKEEIRYKKALLAELRNNYTTEMFAINKNNENMENNLQRLLEMSFGTKDKENADIKDTSKAFRDANEWKLIDPLNVVEIINKLDNEIDAFESQIDYALSESNATTRIEVV